MEIKTFIPADLQFQDGNQIVGIQPGNNILWKGNGWFTYLLSGILALKDKSWKARNWRPWHTGFVVKVLDTGEIVTFQAVNLQEGVCAITYASLEDMGDCRIYHWLDNPNQDAIDRYVEEWNGVPYDVLAYFWVIITVLFNWNFSISDKKLMCWENLSNFDRCLEKELQPVWDEPLISKMMNKLEDKT
jgi:hypothetical protein